MRVVGDVLAASGRVGCDDQAVARNRIGHEDDWLGLREVAEDVFHFAFEVEAASEDNVGIAERADVAGCGFIEMRVGAGAQERCGLDVIAADVLHKVPHHTDGGDGVDADFG